MLPFNISITVEIHVQSWMVFLLFLYLRDLCCFSVSFCFWAFLNNTLIFLCVRLDSINELSVRCSLVVLFGPTTTPPFHYPSSLDLINSSQLAIAASSSRDHIDHRILASFNLVWWSETRGFPHVQLTVKNGLVMEMLIHWTNKNSHVS